MFQVPLFPEQASTIATRIDNLYIALIVVCGGVTVLIAALILYFAVKYRRGKHEAVDIHGNTMLETAWSVGPMIIFLGIFFWGAKIYFDASRAPANALQIHVVAKQWMWKIQHPGGQREINALHIPIGRPIQVTTISQDVIHSFFIPEFRIKWDVLPGRYRSTWFQATKTGEFHLFCSQYCGTQHSHMIGTVYAMKPADYDAWLNSSRVDGSPANEGSKLIQDYACITCHRPDATGRAPNLVGLYGKRVYLEDGRSLIADDNYIRESILDPSAKIVAGFRNIMPVYKGRVTEEEVLDLIEYIKSLSQDVQTQPLNNRTVAPAGPRPGEAPLPSQSRTQPQ